MNNFVLLAAQNRELFFVPSEPFCGNLMEVAIQQPLTRAAGVFRGQTEANRVKPSQTQSNHFLTLTGPGTGVHACGFSGRPVVSALCADVEPEARRYTQDCCRVGSPLRGPANLLFRFSAPMSSQRLDATPNEGGGRGASLTPPLFRNPITALARRLAVCQNAGSRQAK